MKNMTLKKIAEACGGELCGDEESLAEAVSVEIDSRKVAAGGIFIATKGERVDGHDFIDQAAERGALGIVCEKRPMACKIPYILVEDSFRALREIAEYYRKQLSITVVGITGSVGKTSTKEFVACVLSQKYAVLKTQGNFNNEVGLPLTVLSIRDEHEVAVLEMGISDFGEMHRLSKIAGPDICVITNIGQCHLENLHSREGVLQAKSEIFDFMNPKGNIFVNGDDDLLAGIRPKNGAKLVRFGKDPQNEIYAGDVFHKGLLGSQMVIHMGTQVLPVNIPLPGEHMIYNALAAAAVGDCLGLSGEEIKAGIAAAEAVGGRSHVIALPGRTIIDDCYNANPVSMKAAIDLLTTALGRKIAILGDMFELGVREKELHEEVGVYAASKNLDVIICVGSLSASMYEGACRTENGKVYYFETREQMLGGLEELLRPGDNILVKASHGMHFEAVVEALQFTQ